MVVDIPAYISQCAPNVAQVTMQAIISTESKGNPHAIGLNKGYKLKHQPKSMQQAKLWVEYLERNNYNFDVGLAQVNIKNIHKYGYKAADALEPCINLKMASDILGKNYNGALTKSSSSAEALQKAISAYNTGNYSSGLRNGYVQKVYANAKQPILIAQNDVPPLVSSSGSSNSTVVSPRDIKTRQENYKDPRKSKSVLYVSPNKQRISNTSEFSSNDL